jgi:hypothetical protein
MGDYSDIQILMTLAGVAQAGQDKLPGESVDLQERRILGILNSPKALNNPDLATGTSWEAVWVGLSNDRANMSFLVRNVPENKLAAVFRGTDFGMVLDRDEDFRVSKVVPFPQGGPSAGRISEGSMEAFNEVTNSQFVEKGTTLLSELQGLVPAAGPGVKLYVTGHSLGGAIATTVGLFLDQQAKANGWDAVLEVYTYAAPTAGLNDFAAAFDAAFPESSWRIHNVIDAVPCAWQSLADIKRFYPGGPSATFEVKALVDAVELHASGHPYTQPSVNPVPLNQGAKPLKDPAHLREDTVDFLHQIAFEHHGNTYLKLLGAPQIPTLPSRGESPTS